VSDPTPTRPAWTVDELNALVRAGISMLDTAREGILALGIAERWSEDEIVDEIARRAGGMEPDLKDSSLALTPAVSLRERNLIREWVRSRLVQTYSTAGEGLTRDRVVRAVAELRRQDGTWPTQPVTANALGLQDARRIRQVQGPRKWAGIIADAAALLARGG
jgi:hypothetical protein